MRTAKFNLNEGIINFDEKSEVEVYISEIRKYPALSREEELTLTKRIALGDEKAFEKFVKHNLLIVVKMAKKYANRGLSFADLVQYGNMGVMDAARRYAYKIDVKGESDHDNTRFSSYAVWYINKYITDAIENYGRMVRRTHDSEVIASKIRSAIARHQGDEEFKYDLERIAQAVNATSGNTLKVTEKEIREVMLSDMNIISLDTPMDSENEDHSDTIADTIDGHMNSDDDIVKSDRQKILEAVLGRLDEREKRVVKMNFGIGYDYEYNNAMIAETLGISPVTVNAIIKKAVDKMKKATAGMTL